MFKSAKWIWYDTVGTENSYGEFFGEFCSFDSTTVKISCDGDYTLFINGEYASSNQYGDFEHYKSVDEIDITHFTKKGNNKIAILVWHQGKSTQRYKKYEPGVICEVISGGQVVFYTDESTLSRQSKSFLSGFERNISSQLGFSLSYDSTREDGWILGNGEDMKSSRVINKSAEFVKRPNKRLTLTPPVFAREISKNLFDLGKEYVGLFFFIVEADKECKINVSYGECLENGKVKRKIGDRDFSIDYTAKKGKSKFVSYMLRFAARYLQIEADGDVKIKEIGIIPQIYPVNEAPLPSHLCGIDKEIYSICVNTLRLCMMEHYVDCPWREQCLYAFDSRNQMLCGYYAFENKNTEYAKSNLILMSKDRRSDNILSICFPCGIDLTIPSFSLYYIVAVKEYIEHTKDTSIIFHVGEKLKSILCAFLKKITHGLVCTFKDNCHWNFFDWSPHMDGYLPDNKKGLPDITTTVLTLIALDAYREICKLCSLPFAFSNEEEILRKGAREAILQKNGDAHKTELLNALAILANTVSQEEAQEICRDMAQHKLISCSLSMKCFVYDAMIKTDKEKYKDFILNDIRNTYKPMLETKTVWETALGSSDFDNAGSLCHGWSSIPVFYYNALWE